MRSAQRRAFSSDLYNVCASNVRFWPKTDIAPQTSRNAQLCPAGLIWNFTVALW